MATTAFSTLIPRLAPSLPGCPNPTIERAIREAAIRACERTLAWRYVPPKLTLSPGVFEYPYPKPTNTDVHAVFSIVMNDLVQLMVLTLDEVPGHFPEWADIYSGVPYSELWGETPGGSMGDPEYNESPYNGGSGIVLPEAATAAASEPRAVTQLTPDKFIVLPLPDAVKPYQLRMWLALKPKRTATGMDSVVFSELEDAIYHNAMQNLLVMPGVTWADREGASYHARQYLAVSTERRARANLGNMRGSVRVRMQPFA